MSMQVVRAVSLYSVKQNVSATTFTIIWTSGKPRGSYTEIFLKKDEK